MRRVVVFDMDDTLFPERQYVLSGFRAVDAALAGRGAPGFYGRAQAHFEGGSRGNIFDLVLAELGVAVEPGLVEWMVRVYREHRPELSLFEDAKWALDFFRARGPLGLVSDGPLISQRNKFEALKVGGCFAAVVFSDELGRDHWKPSPSPFLRIMERIPGGADEYVYVADNPTKDFLAPRQLGWATIQVARPGGVHRAPAPGPEFDAEFVVDTLFALEKM